MINQNFTRVLYIDMSTEKIRIEKREDLLEYLGGVGVASKLLEENMLPNKDPLDEGQPIVFAIGAISTIFPVVTKTVAMFISPMTGELGESYAGGRMAFTMLNAGYDAIVITGKAKKPSYISIESTNVEIKDARAFWGMNSDVVGQYIRAKEQGSGKRSIIRIGPAGENLCHFASVCVDTYRHFGRMGLGALFGSKMLKALIITGDTPLPASDYKKYFQAYSKIFKKVTNTEIMAKYHDAGTSINVEPLNAIGALPTRNLQQSRFEDADKISGENFASNNLVRKLACVGCPVGCIHIGQYRREFDHGYEYESVSVSYDYELIFSLGSFIGISEINKILELIEAVEQLGLDAVSTGVCLGWATEALEKGLITLEDTIVPLEFNNPENYEKAIKYIASAENDFYKALSKGLSYATKIYGGFDISMQIGGNEMPGYHTGYGSIVGYITAARHSHLCNGGYSYDQVNKEFDKERLVKYLLDEELERCILNSLIICLFARKVYDRDSILMALDAVGRQYTNEDLDKIARRIYKTKLRIKKALGFDVTDVKVPKRLFQTPAMDKQIDEKLVYEMVADFKKRTEELYNSED